MKEGQALQGSPYVEQIEKYASSLKQLSHTFLELEAHKEEFSGADIDGMFDRVKERVCKKCEKNAWCWGENFVHTYQMGYDVLSAVGPYGNELNEETKRKKMPRCEKTYRMAAKRCEAKRREGLPVWNLQRQFCTRIVLGILRRLHEENFVKDAL